MKKFKSLFLIVIAISILSLSIPIQALAVDPVSAATMANAFAQAITAYGASQGVSMTFDVANTDGIGEGVHELWNQYQEDMANSNVTVSDYSNLAASVFPTLWKKTFNYVSVNLDAAARGEVDGFWNWLLSGPAEMTKVDNQYYEWTLVDGSVQPISVFSDQQLTFNGKLIGQLPYSFGTGTAARTYSGDAYYYTCYDGTSYGYFVVSFNLHDFDLITTTYYNTSTSTATLGSSGYAVISSSVYYRDYDYMYAISTESGAMFPENVLGPVQSDSLQLNGDSISVRPYVGDAVPENVYIPDNTDVNYIPDAVSVPLDIPWDDTLFGDGTGVLTDAQSEAITGTVSSAIVDSPVKTLELADTANPPADPIDPSPVDIPLLPFLDLPSFNFNLSGIWHYVREWVASLGAWFTLTFSVWQSLPYAIVVPVYASAVVVIVLGVYKRFFM